MCLPLFMVPWTRSTCNIGSVPVDSQILFLTNLCRLPPTQKEGKTAIRLFIFQDKLPTAILTSACMSDAEVDQFNKPGSGEGTLRGAPKSMGFTFRRGSQYAPLETMWEEQVSAVLLQGGSPPGTDKLGVFAE